MRRGFFVAVSFLVLLFPLLQNVRADAGGGITAEELISDHGKLIEDLVLLGDEIAGLRNAILPMEQSIDEARERLKQISAASTEARQHNRSIKQLEPQLDMYREELSRKLQELNDNLSRLNIVETQLQWEENPVSGSLFRTATRWFQPSEALP